MKKWDNIIINTDNLDSLLDAINEHKNFNPACRLIDYWSGRMGEKILKEVMETHRLPYGFVGDGWPVKIKDLWALKWDKYNLAKAFQELDTRDAQDSIYQANIFMNYYKYRLGNDRNIVMDFGSGYGRLAIPFLYGWQCLTYIGVDYTSCGLLIAPQFVKQALDENEYEVLSWDEDGFLAAYNFISFPAWKLDRLINPDFRCAGFISIHSFQEMECKTINFYINVMSKIAAPKAIFYCVNIGFENSWVPDSWELIFDRPYPVRDGNYNEKMWKIK